MVENEMGISAKEMAEELAAMVCIKAIAPAEGGSGESERADHLAGKLREFGFSPKRFDYTDDHGAKRSNLVVKYGNCARTLWILAHIDTVSEGDASLWKKAEPFKGVVKDGKVYGRGSQDNGQAVIAGIYALKAIAAQKSPLAYNYGLCLVADEETGSRYGIRKLLEEGIFRKGDIFLVPDWGTPKGNMIEIAEKSPLGFKFTVVGKQGHASSPQRGINAFREMSRFALDLDDYLYKKYDKKTALMPTGSTFEMTKHEKNVDSPNILPGKEVFYFDCRIIPEYDFGKIIADVRRISRSRKAKIKVEVVIKLNSPKPLRADAEVLTLLRKTLKEVIHVEPRLVGIGGGTVAMFLRKAGFEAAVWSVEKNLDHRPDEYARIGDMVTLAKVFARLCVSEDVGKDRP